MSADNTDERRTALLGAGDRLVSRPGGLGSMTVAGLVREAGVSEQCFIDSFGDMSAYRRALLTHLMDVVRAEVLSAAAAVPNRPGFERMWHSVESFLDANLRHPAMRKIAWELRTDSTMIELLRRRMGGYAMVLKVELDAIGRPNAAAAARLSVSMVVEAAVAENEIGHAQPEMRRALYAFLKGYCG